MAPSALQNCPRIAQHRAIDQRVSDKVCLQITLGDTPATNTVQVQFCSRAGRQSCLADLSASSELRYLFRRYWCAAFSNTLFAPKLSLTQPDAAAWRPHSLSFQAAFTEQSQSVSQQGRQQQCPDISLLRPKLQQQWDHAKNAHMGNMLITPHSSQTVQWTCPDCPYGHPHERETQVGDRTNNDGCPLCLGKRVCQHNSVATKAPHVAASWDSTANDSTPHDFTAASHSKKQWHCSVCGHKWLAQINNGIEIMNLVALSAVISSVQGQEGGCPLWLNAIIHSSRTGTLKPMPRRVCSLTSSD